MGCKTNELATMEKVPHYTPLPPSSSTVAIDYGNHVIEALLKMSSDTDEDEEETFDQSALTDRDEGSPLYSVNHSTLPSLTPAVLLHAKGKYKLYCSPISQNSASNMWLSPLNEFLPLKGSSSTAPWTKKDFPYSKDDSAIRQESPLRNISEKRRAYSNDECRVPGDVEVVTPRLEKRPTYANLSSIYRTKSDISIPVQDETNLDPLSTSSLSSLTDGYPGFTGDTSDCPYGQNYNKPRGLAKFEYHSNHIKQCRIEKTARTKKVWEKSPKRRQITSRKRKLIKKSKLESHTDQNSPTFLHHDQTKKVLHSHSKSCHKKRIVHTKLKDKNHHSNNVPYHFPQTTDILNETIGRLGQANMGCVVSARTIIRTKHNRLNSQTSIAQSDTSYPASSQTWSTPESMNAEVVSNTSSYGLFKARVEHHQFTSSPLLNATDSSSAHLEELVFPNSSLNLSSSAEHATVSESPNEMSLDECNKAFTQDDTFSDQQSELEPSCNRSHQLEAGIEPTLSDSSVSLSISLGERPDCVGQSCSSDSEPEVENENIAASDTSHISQSSNHVSNILSSTRNSQSASSPDRKGPVIISPISSEKGSPPQPLHEQKDKDVDSSFLDESFLCPLPPKQSTKITSDTKKNSVKICAQLFSVPQAAAPAPRLPTHSVSISSSSSSSHKKSCAAAATKQQNQIPPLVKPMTSVKGKKMSHQTVSSKVHSTKPFCTISSQQVGSKPTTDLLLESSSVYFSPGKSAINPLLVTAPFGMFSSNVSHENQLHTEHSTRPKAHRRTHARSHDKRPSEHSSGSRRRRGVSEHRRSRSGTNNKENTDSAGFDPEIRHHLLEPQQLGPSKDTPHISRDSGLGACRKSQRSSQMASLSNSPGLPVGPQDHQEAEKETGAGSSNPPRNGQTKDGFRLRDKRAVIKNFWNFHKKFIRKDRKTKGDTEFKTLAHF